jgi:RNA polymerase sigma factor (sigma-70 family)
MQIDKSDLEQIINLVVQNTIKVLEDKNLLKPQSANEKTAYQKTEQLLYNYRGFCRIIQESQQEIEDLKRYGVPGTCGGVKEYTNKGGMPQGLVLDEERVECAIRSVQERVQGTVQAIALIDKCMNSLRNDPYYNILEMRYFEGRTQEDIALDYGVSQVTISNNKNRLVRELSMRLFPNQVVAEILQ